MISQFFIDAREGESAEILEEFRQYDFDLSLLLNDPIAALMAVFNFGAMNFNEGNYQESVRIFESTMSLTSQELLDIPPRYHYSIYVLQLCFSLTGQIHEELFCYDHKGAAIQSLPGIFFDFNAINYRSSIGELKVAQELIEELYENCGDQLKTFLELSELVLIEAIIVHYSHEEKASFLDTFRTIFDNRKPKYATFHLIFDRIYGFILRERMDGFLKELESSHSVSMDSLLAIYLSCDDSPDYQEILDFIDVAKMKFVFTSWNKFEDRKAIVESFFFCSMFEKPRDAARILESYFMDERPDIATMEDLQLVLLTLIMPLGTFYEIKISAVHESQSWHLEGKKSYSERYPRLKRIVIETEHQKVPFEGRSLDRKIDQKSLFFEKSREGIYAGWAEMIEIEVKGIQGGTQKFEKLFGSAVFQFYLDSIFHEISSSIDHKARLGRIENEKRRYAKTSLDLARNVREQAAELKLSNQKIKTVLSNLKQAILSIVHPSGLVDEDTDYQKLEEVLNFPVKKIQMSLLLCLNL